ncbi:MAG: hypothetical protein K6D59_04450 [Bacteroidales bacterium]|nr:hypothetical protein [Bacteroidales bacterium]
MKKSTALTIIVLAIIAFFSFSGELQAQNEYRISQPIPDSINSLYIEEGWQVIIRHGEQSSVTIVTPCCNFFEEDNEPQICNVGHNQLTLQANKTMPQKTVVEITLKHKLHNLHVQKNATVQTDNLMFYGNFAHVGIDEGATVTGKSWISSKNLEVTVDHNATLRIDTLQAAEELTMYRKSKAHVDCPTLISANTKVKSDVKSFGSLYQTDTIRNLTVKNVNRSWLDALEGISFSVGLQSPIPLYMNNKSGSPFNRGENYRIYFYWNFLKPFHLTDKFTFNPGIAYSCDWSRLLNSVAYNGNNLVLNTPTSGELPQQHLYSENIGLQFKLNYAFGKMNQESGRSQFNISFGLDVMRNVNARLVTRTMGTDNHWSRTRDKIDVMNPWQLRTFISIGGGPLTRASLGLTYDLLPTFRSGTDADKVHTFGITLSF